MTNELAGLSSHILTSATASEDHVMTTFTAVNVQLPYFKAAEMLIARSSNMEEVSN